MIKITVWGKQEKPSEGHPKVLDLWVICDGSDPGHKNLRVVVGEPQDNGYQIEVSKP